MEFAQNTTENQLKIAIEHQVTKHNLKVYFIGIFTDDTLIEWVMFTLKHSLKVHFKKERQLVTPNSARTSR